MKSKLLVIVLLLITTLGYSQKNYRRIYNSNKNHNDWKLIKSIVGTYGFIDNAGKVVVPPIYKRIGKFGRVGENYSLVKSITGMFGLIDYNGKEVIPCNYEKIQKFGEIENGKFLVTSITGETSILNLGDNQSK